MKKNQLFESIFSSNKIEEVNEGENGKLKYIISGPFTIGNTPNGNNRIYPNEILNKAISKFRNKVSQKRVKMSMDHPEYEGKVGNTAAILLEVTDVQADNMAYYKAQIVDTRVGKDLKAILDAGGQVGVSTRGRSYNCKFEQEWPGLPGKYTIIGDDFELLNIDFVEEPSVEKTEELMQLENTKRSEDMKTLEELQKEYPEIFQQLEKKVQDEKSTLETKVKEMEGSVNSLTENFSKLVSLVKESNPDLFTIIPESKIVEEKDAEIKKLAEEVTSLKTKLEESKSALDKMVAENEKIEKEKYIESLKNTDADYFKFKTLVALFDNCVNSSEVKAVYETNKELVKSLREEANTPTTPKSEVGEGKKESDEITEAQKKDFEDRNAERLNVGLPPLTLESYKQKFVK
jgi:TolA-binding protein